MSRSRCTSLTLILVLLFAAGPLFAGTDQKQVPARRAAAVEMLTNLWHRLIAVVAPLGPEMDPTGTPAPSGGQGTTPSIPPPTNLGPEMDPTG